MQEITPDILRLIIKMAYRQSEFTSEHKTVHSFRYIAKTTVIRSGAKPIKVQSMASYKSFDTMVIYDYKLNREKALRL